MSEAQLQALLDHLFTNGAGHVADRLVLMSADGRDLGGWSRECLGRVIREHLDGTAVAERRGAKRG